MTGGLSVSTARKSLQYWIAAPLSVSPHVRKLLQSSSRSFGLLYFFGLSFGTGSLLGLGRQN